jgi:archaellum biogenesis protein FlaJ (TadC family)
MTDFHFRLILVAFVALVLGQILYSAPRDEKSHEQDKEQKFGWLKRLHRTQLYFFLAAAVSVVFGGLTGIAGMFFFLKWAAVVYVVATLIAKAGSHLLFKGGEKSPIEKALTHSVSAAEIGLFYLVFVGPAKGLFH